MPIAGGLIAERLRIGSVLEVEVASARVKLSRSRP
jgi:hypothetical protein